MAETPPHQIRGHPRTPPTPFHGAAYDNVGFSPRRSARISQRQISGALQRTPDTLQVADRLEKLLGTPRSLRRPSHASQVDLIQSPRPSPRQKGLRKLYGVSPSSPEITVDSFRPGKSVPRTFHFASSSTTMNEGMLPTPVKTPRKKVMPKTKPAARALFQDQSTTVDEVMPSPRRGRKTKRYNGFSLESFREHGEDGLNNIHVFTDSRDRVPQPNEEEDNPFIDQPPKEQPSIGSGGRASKRRKIGGGGKMDPQVEDAIKKDEGMVYVFRGKKVYRRFEDGEEEEEEVDSQDLGLLEHTRDGTTAVKPLKTLTRKSVKPTRLFQTEEQKRERELEKEEEAMTEIEDDIEFERTQNGDIKSNADAEPTLSAVQSGKRAAKAISKDGEAAAEEASTTKRKINSPFDSWKRVKGAMSKSSDEQVSKSRKRNATDALEDTEMVAKKARSSSG